MINIDETLLAMLKEFYNNHKEVISNIHIGGSMSYGFIDNSHDIDIIVMYKENMNQAITLELKQIKRYVMTLNCCILVKSTRGFEIEHTSMMFPYLFGYYPNKPQVLIGDEHFFDNLNLNYLDNLEEIPLYLKEVYHKMVNYYESCGRLSKYNYINLVLLYVYKNKSYEFTQEQKDLINKIHDKHKEDSLTEEYLYLKSEIEKL